MSYFCAPCFKCDGHVGSTNINKFILDVGLFKIWQVENFIKLATCNLPIQIFQSNNRVQD